MTTLWFVRHAVTSHTGKKLSGWMDGIPLTEEGKVQAATTADAMQKIPLKAIYSSPLDRTTQTARAIAKPHGLAVRSLRGIGEVEYGKWTNRSLKVLVRTKLWTQVQQWPSGARFPDGESIREVQVRALAAVEKVVEEHPSEAVCCVSHGDVIKLVMAHYLGVHIDLFQRIVVAPGSISTLALGEHGPMVLGLNAQPMMFKQEQVDEEAG
ncbi:MAG TPA: MSMEG_4193 family putative phosphomutase [Actinomycetota bacterium]|nr:MSMEG_4193 family putative phosphomutase [Actinomycetota bacterium]